ncbi:MAG TPA: DUF6272 family protein [Polyangiaceae bacterium]|jgi:hypothetical protein|nr:DUF6272 family protein [Polyangiaceae bacterium]
MRFSPSVELIDLVRRFIADFYHRLTDDRILRDRLAVATHELLENCVRYSVDGEAKVRVEVSPENRLLITVDNAAHPSHLDSLRKLIEEMNSRKQEPIAFYRELMRRGAKQRDRSGLGLARIHAECDMLLSYSVADERVSVRALAEIEEKKSS